MSITKMSTTRCTRTLWPSTGVCMVVYSDKLDYHRFDLIFYRFLSLQFAVDLARLLQHPAPSEWQEIADKLKIPYDPGLKYHPEFDGYKIGEPFCLDLLPSY